MSSVWKRIGEVGIEVAAVAVAVVATVVAEKLTRALSGRDPEEDLSDGNSK
jgi:hypothetical protein